MPKKALNAAHRANRLINMYGFTNKMAARVVRPVGNFLPCRTDDQVSPDGGREWYAPAP